MVKNWKLWLGFAISAVALVLTFRDIQLDQFLNQLSRAHIEWLLPGFIAFLATLAFRTWRWSVMLDFTPFWTTFYALNIGYLLNMTLPLRLGEIGRAFVISERTDVRMARALSTVVVERMLDLASVVLMFVVFAQFIPMPPVFAQAAFIGGAIVVALLAAFGLMIWQSARVERLLTALSRRIPKLPTEMLLHWFRDIRDGFRLIGTPRKLALVALTTVGVWATNLFVSYFTMAAFMPASLDQAGLVMVMANLGGALPSAPGGIGVVQGFARESLVIPFGIDKNVAVAFAFVWSLWQQLALIVLGLFSLAQVGLSFAKVARGSQQAGRAAPDNADSADSADSASLTDSPAARGEPGAERIKTE